ncbi:MAG: GspE/PulE family protein, partial [Patescibacteria group bacterium]
RGIKIGEEELDKYSEQFSTFRQLQSQVDNAPITEIVSVIMAAAIKSGASDIHIEGEEDNIKVRFRVDGILLDVINLDKDLWKKIISRMKILSGVKINVTDKPQDGRISIYTKNDRVDIRASFLPTNYGESVVMRLLRSSSVGLGFDELGIRDRSFQQLKREVERPNGMIITTGPTGSGKTTTLYAVLKKLNDSETKIITIEDPIEYQLKGVNQSQISEKYTFAHGLRSIVRQDPDVIMVGEIRDLETAEIAIQAALTGHLVLSTIHTNDAAGSVPRFLSMGTKPFLLAPALNAVIGQRLVRRICSHCKTEDELDAENLTRVRDLLAKLPKDEKKAIDHDNLKFYKGTGCEQCQGLGFKGRIGIYEILTMNAELEKLILSGNASEYDMRDNAVKNGMVTMVQDGLLKALEGITSVEEVFRVAE